MSAFIRKHRNLLLLAGLLITLTVSWMVNRQRLEAASVMVNLPVEQVDTPASTALDAFRVRRDETLRADMAALQALCDQESLAAQTREDAAAQLQQLVATHQAQTALEGALTQSGVYPCVAVLTQGSVTIVTEKETLSDGETALVLTLAQAHAGVSPSGVQVITAKGTD